MPSFPPGANLAKPAVVEDRIAWQRDGTGYTRRGNTQIFIVDADLGGTPRQITFGDTSHGNPRWAPDGTKLYFSGDLIPEEGYERGNSEVHAIDLATLEITTLTDRLGPDNGPIPSPDGSMIAYTGYDQNENYSNLSHLYLMDADGSGSRMLAGNLKNSPSGVTWAPDGSGLYYTLGEEGSSNLHFVSTSGDMEKVTDGVHYISGVSIANNGRAAAINSTFYRPNYLITFDLDDADELETLVDYNEDVLAGITLGEVEEIWTESVDGWPVQGWLMKPANFEPGREYPLLLWIHGGPVSMYTVRWNWNWQNFAADGYAVLWTNPRGSTGYGQDFVNGINYLYPGNDFHDLMAGVDAAIERGFIDEDNMFVTGSSGGGVLTAWTVGHTDRFRAAVSQRPVINWHSFVGTTDGSGWYRRFRSYPWEDPVEYAERSPLHYVGNVTTPTMLLSGVEDLRTPMPQAEEFYRALKVLGQETMHVKIPDEYHGSRSVSHRIMTQLYIKAWFDKYRTGTVTVGGRGVGARLFASPAGGPKPPAWQQAGALPTPERLPQAVVLVRPGIHLEPSDPHALDPRERLQRGSVRYEQIRPLAGFDAPHEVSQAQRLRRPQGHPAKRGIFREPEAYRERCVIGEVANIGVARRRERDRDARLVQQPGVPVA